jgi:cyanophycinase-like exopeptidase
MVTKCFSLLPALFSLALTAQSYTSWHTGNTHDVLVQPVGGVCMMGGATEHDGAMRWFLQRAAGGDVLVLRASGSNGYNDYLYSELGVPVNSVETIRFNSAAAAADPYVHERIQRAEAIWFAGGDQWNYVNYWRGTAIDSLVNIAIAERNIVIGGTSAGMAILGGIYFTAQNGTTSSATALANPYATTVTASVEPFLTVPWMADVVTDTHYDNPDRRARHMVFMARAITDHGIAAKGIACNEYVAVTVDENGTGRVWGEWPAYEEYAWFLQANCLTPGTPEVCQPGAPITWDHGGLAVKAYRVPGTMQGTNTFSLADWRTGAGGDWQDWRIVQGVFTTAPGEPMPDCTTAVPGTYHARATRLVPQGDGRYVIQGLEGSTGVRVRDALGREVPVAVQRRADGLWFALDPAATGLRIVEALGGRTREVWKVVR